MNYSNNKKKMNQSKLWEIAAEVQEFLFFVNSRWRTAQIKNAKEMSLKLHLTIYELSLEECTTVWVDVSAYSFCFFSSFVCVCKIMFSQTFRWRNYNFNRVSYSSRHLFLISFTWNEYTNSNPKKNLYRCSCLQIYLHLHRQMLLAIC